MLPASCAALCVTVAASCSALLRGTATGSPATELPADLRGCAALSELLVERTGCAALPELLEAEWLTLLDAAEAAGAKNLFITTTLVLRHKATAEPTNKNKQNLVREHFFTVYVFHCRFG